MFQREERYIVIKLKDITAEEEFFLRNYIYEQGIPTTESVVVEKDWNPEYETVWKLIEDRWKRKNLPSKGVMHHRV